MRPLHEAYLLLAHDEQGALPWRWSMQAWYGLAGAVLEELAQRGRISVGGRKIVVLDPAPTGDAALDSALATLTRRRARSPTSWIVWLPHHAEDMRRATGDALLAQGVVGRDERRVLGLTRIRYPLRDPGALPALRDEVRQALFGRAADERALRLAALLLASDLLDALFPERQERRRAAAIVRERTREDPVGETIAGAVRDAVMGMISSTIA